MSGPLDSAAATVGFAESQPLAGDGVQVPRHAWSVEAAMAGATRPYLALRWGYGPTATSSFAVLAAGVEVFLVGSDTVRFVLAAAPSLELGLPRNAIPVRKPAFDLGITVSPRVRVALSRWWSGASLLVGVPITGTWTVVPSPSFVETTRPPVGLALGGEIGLALSF